MLMLTIVSDRVRARTNIGNSNDPVIWINQGRPFWPLSWPLWTGTKRLGTGLAAARDGYALPAGLFKRISAPFSLDTE
jgi:hypothetical protein